VGARLQKHFDMFFQPSGRGQIERCVSAAVAKVDRGALGEEVAQYVNVRSACREVLSRMSAHLHPCTPSCIIRGNG
jgi:hypothetical protein